MPPFPKDDELYSKLAFCGTEIIHTSSSKTYLPGEARISLSSDTLPNYLEQELTTPDLNKLHPHFWKVATPSSKHVTPLTEQAVRARSIIITENPELHLVWTQDRVYIKPIPKYLLSHAFWEFLAKKGPVGVEEGAKGFLRTWALLVRHKSDFKIAQEKGLVSSKIKYPEFVRFIKGFEQLEDEEVSLRYSYGELRLHRLNIWAPIALRRRDFYTTFRQYGTFFGQYYGPITFVFGVFIIILSSMQVALAVEDISISKSWRSFAGVCRVFSILTLVVVLAIISFLGFSFLHRGFREVWFALRSMRRNRVKGRRVKVEDGA